MVGVALFAGLIVVARPFVFAIGLRRRAAVIDRKRLSAWK
jgi:hypothetical protein